MESDALDAAVAQQTGLASRSIQNLRGNLKKDGHPTQPDKGPDGEVKRWLVQRTLAPRPEGYTR